MASKRGGDIAYKSRRAPDPLKYVGCVASGRAPVWIRIEAGADEIFELWVLVRHFPAEVLKSADWEISRRSRDNLVDNQAKSEYVYFLGDARVSCTPLFRGEV